jgi:two-component system sensor histidine kinase ChvG
MAQEGRLFAAAIEATGRVDERDARRILFHLGQRHLARLRVVDQKRVVIADSSSLGPRLETGEGVDGFDEPSLRDQPIYRLFSLPVRILRRLQGRPETSRSQTSSAPLPDTAINDALAGRYGATTRISAGTDVRSVELHIAIPIRIHGDVEGAVLVSQSTSRVMNALYAVRLDVARVVLVSLVMAGAISLLLGLTIARPLARLKRRSEELLDRRGRLQGGFEPSTRRDEIGDLERALAGLTERLESHLAAAETFASELSHEFKNPLAGIRAATELALEERDERERTRILDSIRNDVNRLERLLSGAREISRIDALLEREAREPVPLAALLAGVLEAFRLQNGAGGPELRLRKPTRELWVAGSEDHLRQVFENLVANAISFSSPEASVDVTVAAHRETAVVTVEDRGPGLPGEHLDRVFHRFFSYRPNGADAREHMGLGLAIVKAIVEVYGGSVEAGNRPRGTGARFTVRLPTTEAPPMP